MTIYYINLLKELSDRFDMEKFLDFQNDVHDPLNSYFIEKLKTLPVRGSLTVTVEEARPDLLAYKIYKDVQYWWLLMEFNNIVLRSDIVNGMSINYFSLDELEAIYYNLKAAENTARKVLNTEVIAPIIDSGSSGGGSSGGNLVNKSVRINELTDGDRLTFTYSIYILPETDLLSLNGNILDRGIDYTINYTTKTIILLLIIAPKNVDALRLRGEINA